MKIKRTIALAAIMLLITAGMSAFTIRHSTGAATPVPAQTQACDQSENDTTEVNSTADTDTLDQQCGNQVEDGTADGQEQAESGVNEQDEAAALQQQAAISADAANQAALAANPGTSVVKTELDNENGTTVYSVQLDNGLDVKVDAANGVILTTDSGANE